MKRTITLLLLSIFMFSAASAQCTFKNTAFKGGEFLSYNLYYNWKFVWVKAGSASMYTVQSNYKGKPAYRASLILASTVPPSTMIVSGYSTVSVQLRVRLVILTLSKRQYSELFNCPVKRTVISCENAIVPIANNKNSKPIFLIHFVFLRPPVPNRQILHKRSVALIYNFSLLRS